MNYLDQFWVLVSAFFKADFKRRLEILDFIAGNNHQAEIDPAVGKSRSGGKWAIVNVGDLPPEDKAFPFSENNC